MLKLQTFGGLTLNGLAAPPSGAAAQRSRLALLAALAAAGEHGMTRDRLFALFWPESDAERARNALNQAVFVLRRDLGDDVLVAGAADLRLNPSAIGSDVAEFEDAVRHEHWETAATLHVGLFLDGVYLRDAPEFERWSARERSRLLQHYESALTRLATAADACHDSAVSVRWWKLLTSAGPLSSRAALGYMSALGRSGDRTAALDFARAYESLLRQELDVPPDREITDFVRTMRASVTREQLRDAAGEGERRYVAHLRAALSHEYEIEQPLERSSLWSAFRARSRHRTETVLLRVVHGTITRVIDVERFVTELRRVCGVQQNNVLPLYDAGVCEDLVYLAGGYPPGLALREQLRKQPRLPIAEALSITSDIAAALEPVHAAGILHLNIKPRNIFLAKHRAYLGDAGIAAALSAAVVVDASQSGLVSLGTPAYMSPEQVNPDARLDERSDIYSLGCVLYQMLSGETPFGDSSPSAMIARRLAESPPRLEGLTIPRGLKEILTSMLARDPADRLWSAAALRVALSRVALDLPPVIAG